MTTIFISYGRRDERDIKGKIISKLHECENAIWSDDLYISNGESWWNAICESVQNCKTLIFYTKNTNREMPSFSQYEIEHALKETKRIIPIFLDKADVMNTILELSQNDTQMMRYIINNLIKSPLESGDEFSDERINSLINIKNKKLRILGETIQDKRKAKQISRAELAKMIEIRYTELLLLENGYYGQSDIESLLLEKLADALDTDLFALEILATVEDDELFSEDDEPILDEYTEPDDDLSLNSLIGICLSKTCKDNNLDTLIDTILGERKQSLIPDSEIEDYTILLRFSVSDRDIQGASDDRHEDVVKPIFL